MRERDKIQDDEDEHVPFAALRVRPREGKLELELLLFDLCLI